MVWPAMYSAHTFDEMIGPDGRARAGCVDVVTRLEALGADLLDRQQAAEAAIRAMGITFTLYADGGNVDRHWPMDVIPRIIALDSWSAVTNGLTQRLTALNHFIDDLYHDQKIVKDGVFPAELLGSSANYLDVCEGVNVHGGVGAHQRQRPRAGRVRPLLRVGGQPANSVRGVIHAREPSGQQACLRRPLPRSRYLADRRLHRAAEQPVEGVVAAAGSGADRGGAHARGLQLGVLRTRTPGDEDGRAPRRRLRSRGGRRRRLYANRRWSDPRRCDLPSSRRLVPGPRRVPARLSARSSRADQGVADRQRRDPRTLPEPAWPTTRSCIPMSPT